MATPQQISLVAGVLLSLVAFYFPGVGPRYEKLGSQEKAQLMGAAIIVVGLASFLLAYYCIGPACLLKPVDLPDAAWELALAIFSALASNQATYLLARKLQ